MHKSAFVFGMAALMFTGLAQAHDNAGVNKLYSGLSAAVAEVDTNKVAALYGPDSLYLGTGLLPLVGAETISNAFVESWKKVSADGAHISLKFRLLRRLWHGPDEVTDVGFSRFDVEYTDKGKPPHVFYDKFVTLSQRQPDGSWRWRVDTDNKLPEAGGATYFDELKPITGLPFDN